MRPAATADSISRGSRSFGKRLARFFVLAGVPYLGVLLLLSAFETSMLFHPTRAAEAWLAPPSDRVEDVNLGSADGQSIHAWWCPTPSWKPADGALLHCHGNAGNLSHRADSIRQLQRHLGLAILIFDYPGYGHSTGSPTEAGCYAAADAAYDWLVEARGVPPDRLVLFGKSLGGGVAVELAHRREHRALALFNTFTSVPDMARELFPWLPVKQLVRNRFESVTKIAACRRPVFIAHGTADQTIPFSHGQRLFEAANQPKRFVAMPGHDHNDPLPKECLEELRGFLETSR